MKTGNAIRKVIQAVKMAAVTCLILLGGILLQAGHARAATNPYPMKNYSNRPERSCTSYAWQMAYDRTGLALNMWGNAGSWYNNAKKEGYATGSTPRRDSLAIWSGGQWGHVAYVDNINQKNGKIHVREAGFSALYKNGTGIGSEWTGGKVNSWRYGEKLVGYIYLKDIKKSGKITLSNANGLVYNGKSRKPGVTVKLGKLTLKQGTDYTVTYKNNTNAGTATVTVTGKGNYMGSKTATFTIAPYDINKFSSIKADNCDYTGKALTPAIKITGNSTMKSNCKKGSGYTLAYCSNVKPGKATITMTGRGNYKGSRKTTFYIRPAKSSVQSHIARSTRITVSWKSVNGAGGYELTWRKKGAKRWNVRNLDDFFGVSAVIDASPCTTYEIRVRPFVRVDGFRLYARDYSGIYRVRTPLF
ncbi:MAG: CHAP domain-containing protein [Eubacterium sp.]|nr:CHAP domain-containing protein [Eubacterium sp.]